VVADRVCLCLYDEQVMVRSEVVVVVGEDVQRLVGPYSMIWHVI
jgi:hypothetical protein